MSATKELSTEEAIILEVKIQVDYRPGRWGKVFHIFDLDGREIVLHQKEAVKMARAILKIAKGKEVTD